MNKLKRRDFLKLFGTSVIAPIALKAEGVRIACNSPPAAIEKITPISELKTEAKKGEAAIEPTAADYIEVNERDWDVFEGDWTVDFYHPIYCCWQFGSQECGYKGNDIMCFKSFKDCKAKGNEARYGGFKPIEELGKKEHN